MNATTIDDLSGRRGVMERCTVRLKLLAQLSERQPGIEMCFARKQQPPSEAILQRRLPGLD